MDLYELLTTPIDDLYDMGILREPEAERNVKQNTHTFVCSECNDEYTETWARNNPDRIAISINCSKCYTKTMRLSHTTPHTLAYRSRAMSMGSFSDDMSRECWACGQTEQLTPYRFSNGQDIKLCSVHLREYVPHILRALKRREDSQR